jgi:hypothetical protein
MMEDIYGGAQPPAVKKRRYVKRSNCILISAGHMGYYMSSESPAGDPPHPSAPSPVSNTDRESYPTPLMPPPASAPPSTPLPSESPNLSSFLQPDIASPLSINSESAAPGQPSVVDSVEDLADSELLELAPSPVESAHSHGSDSDSQYNKLLDEIIQWS